MDRSALHYFLLLRGSVEMLSLVGSASQWWPLLQCPREHLRHRIAFAGTADTASSVGHKTTHTQIDTARTGCLNRPWRLDAHGRHNAMYQTERTLVNTATNALDNKCSTNTPPSPPRLLDPTAEHDDEDCVLLKQTADPNGAYETQDDLGAPARNHLQPRNFLLLCKPESSARHSSRVATLAPASSSVATLLPCQRHKIPSRFDRGIF